MNYSSLSGFVYFWFVSIPSNIAYFLSIILIIIDEKKISDMIVRNTVDIEFSLLIIFMFIQFFVGIYNDIKKTLHK